MKNENALPAQLRLAAEIMEKGLRYEVQYPGSTEWDLAGEKRLPTIDLNAGAIIRLAPKPEAPAELKPPLGYRLATEEDRKKLPHGAKVWKDERLGWQPSIFEGADRTSATNIYAVPIHPDDQDKPITECENCNGTGFEICTNPDHGLLDAGYGEITRLGCPACGHDPQYRTKEKCETCKGSGSKLKLGDQDKPTPFDLNAHVIANGFRPLAEGEQWHRQDFTAEMLPMGTRPLFATESHKVNDEFFQDGKWTECRRDHTAYTASDYDVPYRTTRPLPALSASPQEGKSLVEAFCEAVMSREGNDSIYLCVDLHHPDSRAIFAKRRPFLEAGIEAVAAEVSRQHKEEVEHWCEMHTIAIKLAEAAEARVKELEASIPLLDAEIEAERKISSKEHALAADWCLKARQSEEQAQRAFNEQEARISDLERQLAESELLWNNQKESIKRLQEVAGVSTLRPIAEAGDLAEGCVRINFYQTKSGAWSVGYNEQYEYTHFADLRLPIDASKKAETFEAHGHTWTKHVPGDPMPCDAGKRIHHMLQWQLEDDDDDFPVVSAGNARWDKNNGKANITGWRYADAEPEKVVKPEPFNESKWIWMMEWCRKQRRDASRHRDWAEAEKQWNSKPA